MQRLIVLLRGVMPYGRNKTPMAVLREVLTRAGYGRVETYIQSGNVVLDTDQTPEVLAISVRRLIREEMGPDLAVIVRDAGLLRAALADNPWPDLPEERIFHTFFGGKVPPDRCRAMLDTDYAPERLHINGDHACSFIPGSAARALLTNAFLERRSGLEATTRNVNTTRRLVELGSL